VSSLPQNLLKYLRKRPFNGSWTLEGHFRDDYDACIIIPALAEADNLPETLESLSKNPQEFLDRTLIVVVVNHRVDTILSLQRDNQKTLALLRQYPSNNLQLTWVNACTQGLELPDKQGVGLARKIGFDLALSHLNCQTNPFLISLDADTLVHPNYLPALYKHFLNSSQGGATIPFRHRVPYGQENEYAIRSYELYLRSYAYGLSLARSPYAYTSIGSAFACTAEAYIQAGGMNRRQAGEDFYFLQQVAKTTRISHVHGTMVFPSSRTSTRVPFGTGVAVSSQTEAGPPVFTFSEKSAFATLKEWLILATTHWQANPREVLDRACQIDPRLGFFLRKLNFEEVWSQLKSNHREKNQFINNFHCWFDGLRSRQLLTSLSKMERDNALVIVNELFRWGGMAEKQTESEQLITLEQLQGVIP